jgi:antimicrobial peptide system SdpA family protein
MAISQCRSLRRGFRRFVDAFRTPDCNEAVRCAPVSRALFTSLTIIVAGGVLWAAFPQLPSNVLSSNRTLAGPNLLAAAFPQGWGFYTHYSMTEELYHVYRTATPTSLMDRLPYAEPRNLFGLDRAPKKQTAEVDRLVKQIHGGQWQSCTSDDQCRNSAIRPIAIRNHAPNPTYCGAVTVIGYTMVPWASRRLVSGSTIDSRAVRLDIQCIRD